jgi:hypothetical protein
MTGNTSLESQLYTKFGIDSPPDKTSNEILQQLSAFWQNFGIHKRKCDKTGKPIVSVYDEHCPYPVWHKEEWVKHADPPQAEYDAQKPFFDQLWRLFQNCPIAHNMGSGNQNCEYTDDWWYGKNCYLSHSGYKCEDCQYVYRCVNVSDCQFCAMCFDCELSSDLINCYNCFHTVWGLNSRNCRDSAFLFDCRNCSDCLFCWNLRNKQYCIHNKQYSKEEYEKERQKYDFSSRSQFDAAKTQFRQIMQEKAWWRHDILDLCQNCSGDVLEKCKNCQNCFFAQNCEDCVNCIRCMNVNDNLHCVSSLDGELIYYSVTAQANCYDIRFSYNVINSKYLEYCAQCLNCQYCFGCCGLVNGKYCIFNKQYSEEEYHAKIAEIKAQLREEGIYGQFFPHYFAANSYEESLAMAYWPLSRSEQEKQGFRLKTPEAKDSSINYLDISEIPDNSTTADATITKKHFWDAKAQRPFHITEKDLTFAQKLKVPLPNSFYINRMRRNYSYIFFNGSLRTTSCAKSGQEISTALPSQLDGRILSLEEYHKILQ